MSTVVRNKDYDSRVLVNNTPATINRKKEGDCMEMTCWSSSEWLLLVLFTKTEHFEPEKLVGSEKVFFRNVQCKGPAGPRTVFHGIRSEHQLAGEE